MAQTYFTSSVPPAPRCLPEPLQKPSTWMSPALQPDIICSPEKVFCYRLVLSVCSLKGSFFPLLFLLQSKEFSCKLSLQQFSSTHKTEVNVIPPRNPTTQLQYLATHGQSCFNQTLTHFSPLPTLLCSRSLTAEDLYKQIRSSHFLAEKPTIASQGIESDTHWDTQGTAWPLGWHLLTPLQPGDPSVLGLAEWMPTSVPLHLLSCSLDSLLPHIYVAGIHISIQTHTPRKDLPVHASCTPLP